MIYLHLKAPSDINGNPRRCYLVLSREGTIIDCIDEGYEGEVQVTKAYPGATRSVTLRVPVTTYKEALAFGEEARRRRAEKWRR